MSVLFTLQQFILVMFLSLTVLFYISTPLQMMLQPQWFFKGSLVLVMSSSVLSGSDHLDVLIIRSGRSVLCQVWSSWYSSIREVPRQLWRCTSSPSGCPLSSCWWDRQKLTSGLLMSEIKQLTLQTGPVQNSHSWCWSIVKSWNCFSLGLILIGFYPTLLSCVEMFSCR